MKRNKNRLTIFLVSASMAFSWAGSPVLAKEQEDGVVGTLAFALCDDYINIRSSADIQSDITGKIYNNCAATIVGSENGWYEITSGNASGYVSAEYFATGDEARKIADQVAYNVATVHPEALMVRTQADEGSEVLDVARQAEELEVVEWDGDWMKVALDQDTYGYVNAYYVDYNTYYPVAETLEEEQQRLADGQVSRGTSGQAGTQAQNTEAQAAAPQETAPASEAAVQETQGEIEDTEPENTSPETEYVETEYTDPETDYVETEYTEPEYTDPETGYVETEYTEPEYTDPETEYVETEYTEPEYTDPETEYVETEYTEPEYTDPETEYVETEYMDPETEYVETEYTEPEAEYTEPETEYVDPGNTALGQQIADYAVQFVGNPYVYGGTSLTNGTDCSGFTQSVLANFGIYISRTAADQSYGGTAVDMGSLQPGDLIFYASGGYVGHVALYIGGGQIVHASTEETGIIISNYDYNTPYCARRYW